MSDKLGYTFYPKDYISDPDVMMMTSAERGIYRDLIDLAYMNANKIKYSLPQLAKYCNDSEESVKKMLEMKGKKVGDFWEIPSCSKRIKKAEISRKNGTLRGAPKAKPNPEHNPDGNPEPTQTGRQREREGEIESKEKVKEYVFGNAIFLDGLKTNHRGKNFDAAFNDCYAYHSVSERPPRDEREWKQKFVSWLTRVEAPKEQKVNYKY